MYQRERLHTLIDTLPEDKLQVALQFLERLDTANAAEPLWSLRDAPLEDEPFTADDEAALAESERDVAEGRVVSHAEARRLLLGEEA